MNMKTYQINLGYGEETVAIQYPKYGNGRTAIQLWAVEHGQIVEPFLTATCNLPDAEIADDEVAVKDWSENEGVYKWLVENGLVSPAIRAVPTGFVEALICT